MLASAIYFWVCHKTGSVNNGPFWCEIFKLFCCRTQKHVIGKHVAPRILVNDTNVQFVILIGASIAIPNKNFFSRQIVCYFVVKLFKLFGIERNVDIAPPYSIASSGIFHNKTVFWRASCEFSRVHSQSTRRCLLALSFFNGDVVKLFGG